MIVDLIKEYPYAGTITRTTSGKGMQTEVTTTIYEGVMDEHMTTDEEGKVMQTSSYVVSIPLIKDSNDKYIIPHKGDKITITRLGETYSLIVDNADPSQLGGVSIYATRNSWK